MPRSSGTSNWSHVATSSRTVTVSVVTLRPQHSLCGYSEAVSGRVEQLPSGNLGVFGAQRSRNVLMPRAARIPEIRDAPGPNGLFLEQPLAERVAHQLGPASQIQLLHHVGSMRLDGARADAELVGYLLA